MLGQKIGSYEILEEIGRGGMATVYRAYQSSVNRFVAIKLIQPGIMLEPTIIERFTREAQLVAQLEHVHILPIYDFDGAHNPPYIVMRYLPTGTLKDVMKQVILPLGEILHLFRQIATAIDYSHRQGVVHRDIKPSNIMIDAEGNALLTDFGIARLMNAKTALTGSGATIGTPAYMSPEQGLGQEVDGRADIYALAVVLYELLTDKMPYAADTPLATIYKHIHDPIPNILDDNPELPPEMVSFFEQALAKNPDDRFQTALELVDAFEEVIGGEVSTRPAILKNTATQIIEQLANQRESIAPTDNNTDMETFTPASDSHQAFGSRSIIRLLSVLAIGCVVALLGWFYWSSIQNDHADSARSTQTATVLISENQNTTEIAQDIASSTTAVPSEDNTPTTTYTLSAGEFVDTLEYEETSTEIAGYTATPTLDWTQTIDAERTIRVLNQATEITWTPLPSDTPTATFTSSPTLTDTPSYTPTFTDTYTSTPTNTSTFTTTPTETPTDTSTFTDIPSDTPSKTSTFTTTPTLTRLELAALPISSNADWEPYTEVIQGSEMVLVPAGCFTMGNDSGDSNERPAHKICFAEPFWIDTYEVTNADYGSVASNCYFSSEPNEPRNCVNWYDARDFCEARGARLPTEAEWAYAARGPDGLLYPWGNEFVAANVVYGNIKETRAVGSRPDGASWVGALDMSGNLWEWTNSIYADYPYNANDGREDPNNTSGHRVLRGGSFFNAAENVSLTKRHWNHPTYVDSINGFRCAYDATYNAVSQAEDAPLTNIEKTNPLEIAQEGVTTNSDWEPYSEIMNGVAMVLVPAGVFMMGSDETEQQFAYELCLESAQNGAYCEKTWFEKLGPASVQVFGEPFWIDETEVTRAMYQLCIEAGVCDVTPASDFSTETNHPIDHVTWFQAKQYCEWREARLPTEAEWEYAARGPYGLKFPWGNEFIATFANHCDINCGQSNWARGMFVNMDNDDGFAGVAPVGSYPAGASWVGALDMAGNEWEWTNTIFMDYPYNKDDGREDTSDTTSPRVLRGGSLFNASYHLHSADRIHNIPTIEDHGIGFRCARSIN